MSPIFTRVAENPGISFHSKYYIKAWLFPRSKKLKIDTLRSKFNFYLSPSYRYVFFNSRIIYGDDLRGLRGGSQIPSYLNRIFLHEILRRLI